MYTTRKKKKPMYTRNFTALTSRPSMYLGPTTRASTKAIACDSSSPEHLDIHNLPYAREPFHKRSGDTAGTGARGSPPSGARRCAPCTAARCSCGCARSWRMELPEMYISAGKRDDRAPLRARVATGRWRPWRRGRQVGRRRHLRRG
jgi:hypothetical protein